ncbi:hypothetical protein ENUP19_0120G0011 [Entamoeba nuttalli]|uniref:NAD dependent epimerase/dehydratase family protein n=2 Tax=Entamoeba nuttalli TaxID=412467 RepID=K2GBK1_ENTNP|nr:NAD dependent epimerase/dehydratase family protein [Entamoeba nuttalli P19]EKE39921.1 NAD dependent epimerase/dehydratase family protein [Entamoeba nuttalli P19]|eukprot:XP_008857743.1 NAD dependent epimerase/dehydratase family protein [Entamoeba nuttalli P19]
MAILLGIIICLILYICILILYSQGMGSNWYTPNMTGKVVCITGGSSGIGLEIVKYLKQLNATIIVLGRTNCLISGVKNIYLDLSDLNKVKETVKEIHSVIDHIDILINNAGCVAIPSNIKTAQGYDITVGVNHIGHALLTLGILDLIKKSQSPRIIVMSSLSAADWHQKEIPFNWKDEEWDPEIQYPASKLANSLFAIKLAQLNPDIKCVHVHPGLVWSKFWRYMTPIMKFIYTVILFLFSKTPLQGAQTAIYCALAPNIESGKYYADCIPSEVNPLCNDQTVIDSLWEKTKNVIENK